MNAGQHNARGSFGKFKFMLVVAVIGIVLSMLSHRENDPTNKARPGDAKSGHASAAPDAVPADTEEILFVYGSEKEKWIAEATAEFNRRREKLTNAKIARVRAVAMGSGECMEEVLAGRLRAHLVSPASGAFIELGNAESVTATGKPLVGETRNLVLSPVVIALWKPMAQALGWPQKKIGWADILRLSLDPKGWASLGHPEWGKFKFGHTNPKYSNSGLISLLAEVYAANGKTRGLSLQDVNAEATAKFLHDIEHSVVHYGSSTGFFGKKMFAGGPGYLSAAVLYENMIVDSASRTPPVDPPVVAIYPTEGTFWSDHPCGIVERDWVTVAHKEGAQKYMDFLLGRDRQERALHFGFRPGDPAIKVGAPIDAAHGADPAEPRTTLAVPSAEVIDAVLKLWQKNKKHSDIVLVFDRSGSMREGDKIVHAKQGVREMLQLLGDEDAVSLLVFNNELSWVLRDTAMKNGGREKVLAAVDGLFPGGGTALYDATGEACTHLRKNPKPDCIRAVVVLTDGADTNSHATFEQILQQLHAGSEDETVRLFTIGYGEGARRDRLEPLSNATQSRFFAGNQGNIRDIFKDISTFF